MKRDGGESHASVHRKAVTEINRTLLNRDLAKIWEATHVAIYRTQIYAYGSKADAQNFAKGLHGVEVRAITTDEQNKLALHKRQAYGNPHSIENWAKK